MKICLTILAFTFVMMDSAFCQEERKSERSQLIVSTGIDLSTRSFSSTTPEEFNVFDYNKTDTKHSQVYGVKYGYRILKNYNLFAVLGYDFTTTAFTHQVIDPEYNRHLDNIDIRSNQSRLRVGLNQQIKLYDSRVILAIGADFLFGIPHVGTVNISSPMRESENSDWIHYSYEYDLFQNEYYENGNFISEREFNRINTELNLGALFRLKYGYLQTSFTYGRNNHKFYDYAASFEYYINGSPTPTLQSNIHPSSPKRAITDHFVGFRVGYVFAF
ncbi:MAG: hypothetical protein NXI10_05575 [bacterium]|nr:hypothetical protein [bacterium]